MMTENNSGFDVLEMVTVVDDTELVPHYFLLETVPTKEARHPGVADVDDPVDYGGHVAVADDLVVAAVVGVVEDALVTVPNGTENNDDGVEHDAAQLTSDVRILGALSKMPPPLLPSAMPIAGLWHPRRRWRQTLTPTPSQPRVEDDRGTTFEDK